MKDWSEDPLVRVECTDEAWRGFDPRPLPWEDARAKRPLPEGFLRAKKSVSRVVLETNALGEHVFVKQSLPVTLRNRLSQRIVGSKSMRELAVTAAYTRAGIRTVDALMAADARSGANYLVTRGAPAGWEPLDDVFAREGLQRELLDELAGYTCWLHQIPAWHSDYRTDHIWWTGAPGKAPMSERFALIDLDGCSIGRRVTQRQRARALHQLFMSLDRHGIDEEQTTRFLELYDPRRQGRFKARRVLARARAARAKALETK